MAIPVSNISLTKILIPFDIESVPHTKLVISMRKFERILLIWWSLIGCCNNLTMMFQNEIFYFSSTTLETLKIHSLELFWNTKGV